MMYRLLFPIVRNLSSGKSWTAAHRASPQGSSHVPGRVLSKRQKRIMYRCGQRGWLELDVLMGRWAASRIPEMDDKEDLASVEALLDAETPHLLQWVLGQAEPPAVHDTPVLKDIREFATGADETTGEN